MIGFGRRKENTNGSGAGSAAPPQGEQGSSLDSYSWMLGGQLVEPYGAVAPRVEDLQYMISRDPQAKGLYNAYTLWLKGATGELKPADGDRGEHAFVERILFGNAQQGGMTTNWRDVIAQMGGRAVETGRACFEVVWDVKNIDGTARHVIHKLAYRPTEQITIRLDDNGSYNGYTQRGYRANGQVFEQDFDPVKTVVYFRQADRAPLRGESAFLAAYFAHKDKVATLKLWREHLQQFALRIIIALHKKGAQKDAKDGLWGRVKRLKGGGRILLDPDEELKILDSTSASEEFERKVRYLDAQMALSILCQFLMLGTGSNTGAWALSKDHSDFFLQALWSELQDMAAAINLYVIAPLVRLNFGDDAAYPVYEFKPLANTEKRKALDLYEKLLTSASGRADAATMEALREAGLPEAGVDPDRVEEIRKELEAAQGTPPDNSDEAVRVLALVRGQIEALEQVERSLANQNREAA